VQRLHAAVAAPGQAVAGWEAVGKLVGATGGKAAYAHGREVYKDMLGQVSAFAGAPVWGREVRPLALRFAGSRG
jgi:hypothetical protein